MHQSPVSMLTRALDNEVKIKKNKLHIVSLIQT